MTDSEKPIAAGASTEPPREAVWIRVESSPDLLGIVRAREIQNDIQRLIDRNWGSGVTVAIDAHATGRAGAASTEATPPLDVVQFIRNETGLDKGWEYRKPGVDWINPFDLDAVLAKAVRASTEATERPDLRAALERLTETARVIQGNGSNGEKWVAFQVAINEACAALTGAPEEEREP